MTGEHLFGEKCDCSRCERLEARATTVIAVVVFAVFAGVLRCWR